MFVTGLVHFVGDTVCNYTRYLDMYIYIYISYIIHHISYIIYHIYIYYIYILFFFILYIYIYIYYNYIYNIYLDMYVCLHVCIHLGYPRSLGSIYRFPIVVCYNVHVILHSLSHTHTCHIFLHIWCSSCEDIWLVTSHVFFLQRRIHQWSARIFSGLTQRKNSLKNSSWSQCWSRDEAEKRWNRMGMFCRNAFKYETHCGKCAHRSLDQFWLDLYPSTCWTDPV